MTKEGGMSEINCNNCAVSDFKESLCHRCAEMKRLGRAEDIEGLLIKAFPEVDSPAKSNCIERQAAIDAIVNTVSEIGLHDNSEVARYGATFRQHEIIDIIEGMPSAPPEFTDSEIQKMQELEQAQIKKAYELGFEEGKESARREVWEDGRDRLD